MTIKTRVRRGVVAGIALAVVIGLGAGDWSAPVAAAKVSAIFENEAISLVENEAT